MPICPTCSSPLLGDERFCLQCGTRLVEEPEPRQSWAVPAVIVGAIALLAVGGVVFALARVSSDAEREATEPAAVVEGVETVPAGPGPTGIAAWPEGRTGYTVVLATAPDEPAARARATTAIGGGVRAGVLDSEDHRALAADGWVVFAGRFDTREAAAAEAARYAGAGFPDARAGFVGDR